MERLNKLFIGLHQYYKDTYSDLEDIPEYKNECMYCGLPCNGYYCGKECREADSHEKA